MGLWVMGQWSVDCGCCHVVIRFKKKFLKRIWDENTYNFLVISSLIHDWLTVLEHTGHMWACWFLGFSNNPCKMRRTHAQTEMSVHWFGHLFLVPLMAIGVSPVRGTLLSMLQIFSSLLSWVHSVVVRPTVSHARVHSCTRISSPWLNLAVLSSPLLPSPCGTARKHRVLIELSPSIAYPLPASCPQALEDSF